MCIRDSLDTEPMTNAVEISYCPANLLLVIFPHRLPPDPVSYTHLDVYKRQQLRNVPVEVLELSPPYVQTALTLSLIHI